MMLNVAVISAAVCVKAKKALATLLKPEDMHVIELDQRDDGQDIQDVMLEMTGARSVPRVFIGGKFIGGGDETVAKVNNGEVKQMLGI